jgi:hypothetical protein
MLLGTRQVAPAPELVLRLLLLASRLIGNHRSPIIAFATPLDRSITCRFLDVVSFCIVSRFVVSPSGLSYNFNSSDGARPFRPARNNQCMLRSGGGDQQQVEIWFPPPRRCFPLNLIESSGGTLSPVHGLASSFGGWPHPCGVMVGIPANHACSISFADSDSAGRT